jgi:hypothetical protein
METTLISTIIWRWYAHCPDALAQKENCGINSLVVRLPHST